MRITSSENILREQNKTENNRKNRKTKKRVCDDIEATA